MRSCRSSVGLSVTPSRKHRYTNTQSPSQVARRGDSTSDERGLFVIHVGAARSRSLGEGGVSTRRLDSGSRLDPTRRFSDGFPSPAAWPRLGSGFISIIRNTRQPGGSVLCALFSWCALCSRAGWLARRIPHCAGQRSGADLSEGFGSHHDTSPTSSQGALTDSQPPAGVTGVDGRGVGRRDFYRPPAACCLPRLPILGREGLKECFPAGAVRRPPTPDEDGPGLQAAGSRLQNLEGVSVAGTGTGIQASVMICFRPHHLGCMHASVRCNGKQDGTVDLSENIPPRRATPSASRARTRSSLSLREAPSALLSFRYMIP